MSANYLRPGLRPPAPLFRDDRGATRYYALCDETGAVRWFPSVTSVIRDTSPTPQGLMEWYIKHGREEANRLRDAAADYGTALHIAIASYFDGEELTFHDERLAKDMMAWHQFVRDRNVEVVASEVPIYLAPKYKGPEIDGGVAGTADLICELDFDKKRVLALIDIKSGKNSYRDHAVQLEFYKLMWNESFDRVGDDGFDPTVTHVYNWHPKEWTKAPSYSLVNQTGVSTEAEVITRLNLWHCMYKAEPRPRMLTSGVKIVKGGAMPPVVIESPDDVVRAKFEALTQGVITADEMVLTDDYTWGHA